jgi:hypothetical protein
MEAARPWRTATLVTGGIATVELVLLIVAGLLLVGKSVLPHAERAAASRPAAKAKPAAAPKSAQRPVALPPPPPAVAHRPRRRTAVLVLNGNGETGAAASAASRVRSRGYPVRGVGNARRSDYARSVVMYRPGFRGEAVRFARDLRVPIVSALDGLPPGALHGAQLAFVVGH